MKYFHRIVLFSSLVLSVRNQAPDDRQPVRAYKSNTHDNYQPWHHRPHDYYKDLSDNRAIFEHERDPYMPPESYEQMPQYEKRYKEKIPSQFSDIYRNLPPSKYSRPMDDDDSRIPRNPYRYPVPRDNYMKQDLFNRHRSMRHQYDGIEARRRYENSLSDRLKETIVPPYDHNKPPNYNRNPDISYSKESRYIQHYEHDQRPRNRQNQYGNSMPPGPETSRRMPSGYDKPLLPRAEQTLQDQYRNNIPTKDRKSLSPEPPLQPPNDYVKQIPPKSEETSFQYPNMPNDLFNPLRDDNYNRQQIDHKRYKQSLQSEPVQHQYFNNMAFDNRGSQPLNSQEYVYNVPYNRNLPPSGPDAPSPASEQFENNMPHDYDRLLPPETERSIQQQYDINMPRNYDRPPPTNPEKHNQQQYDPNMPERPMPEWYNVHMPQNYDRPLPPGPKQYHNNIPLDYNRPPPLNPKRPDLQQYKDSDRTQHQQNDNNPARSNERQYYSNMPRNYDRQLPPNPEKPALQQYDPGVLRNFDRQMPPDSKRSMQDHYDPEILNNYNKPPLPGPDRPYYQQYVPPNYNIPERPDASQYGNNIPTNNNRSIKQQSYSNAPQKNNRSEPARLNPQPYDTNPPLNNNRQFPPGIEGPVRDQYANHVPQNYERSIEQKMPQIKKIENGQDTFNQPLLKNNHIESKQPEEDQESNKNYTNLPPDNVIPDPKLKEIEEVALKENKPSQDNGKNVSYYPTIHAKLETTVPKSSQSVDQEQDPTQKRPSPKKIMKQTSPKVPSHKHHSTKENPDLVEPSKALSKRKHKKKKGEKNKKMQILKTEIYQTASKNVNEQLKYESTELAYKQSRQSNFKEKNSFHNHPSSDKNFDTNVQSLQRKYDYPLSTYQVATINRASYDNLTSDQKWIQPYNQNTWRDNDYVNPNKGIQSFYGNIYKYPKSYMYPSQYDRKSHSSINDSRYSPSYSQRYGPNFNDYYPAPDLRRQNLTNYAFRHPETQMGYSYGKSLPRHKKMQLQYDNYYRRDNRNNVDSRRISNIKRNTLPYSHRYSDVYRNSLPSRLYKMSNLKLRYGEAATPERSRIQNSRPFRRQTDQGKILPVIHKYSRNNADMKEQIQAAREQAYFKKKMISRYTGDVKLNVDSLCTFCEVGEPVAWCGCSRSCKDSVKGWQFDDFWRMFQRQRSLAGIYRCRWRKFFHDNSWYFREMFKNIFYGLLRKKAHHVKPLTARPKHGWLSASNGIVPKGAFQAGTEKSDKTVYVARAYSTKEQGYIPGMLIDGDTCAKIYVAGNEECNSSYQILIGQYTWFEASATYEGISDFHVDRLNANDNKTPRCICCVISSGQLIVTLFIPDKGCYVASNYKKYFSLSVYKSRFSILLD